MADLAFDLAGLERELSAVRPRRRVAFAASCCERLLPNYVAFWKEGKRGSPAVLREALDAVWTAAMGQEVSSARIDHLYAQVDRVIPDTEVFSSDYTSPALDAGAALEEALRCCVDYAPARAARAASLARDTVDMFIQVRDSLQYGESDFEERISRDALMVSELQRQRNDLFVASDSTLSDSDVASVLRRSSENQSNIRVG
jgi:uncharacterized protein YjaG (DUF416 family)